MNYTIQEALEEFIENRNNVLLLSNEDYNKNSIKFEQIISSVSKKVDKPLANELGKLENIYLQMEGIISNLAYRQGIKDGAGIILEITK